MHVSSTGLRALVAVALLGAAGARAGAAPAWRFEPGPAPRSFVAARIGPEARIAADRLEPAQRGMPWLRFAGAADAAMAGQGPAACRVTDLSARVGRSVPAFSALRVLGAWPGVDVVHHARAGRLEHDFVVAPGADPGRIEIVVEDAREVRLVEGGALEASGLGGTLRLEPPVAWQDADGERKPVACAFALRGRRVSFSVGEIDPGLPLVVDPVVGWSAWMGGTESASCVDGVATSPDGSVVTLFVHGGLEPTQGTFSPEPAPHATSMIGCLEPGGEALRWATYLPPADFAAMARLPDGRLVLAGSTEDGGLPTTGAPWSGGVDGYVAVLNADGTDLLASTYVGTGDDDRLRDVAIAQDGDVLVAGRTSAGARESRGLVVRLSPGLDAERFRRILGGSGRSEAMHVASQRPTDDVLVVFETDSDDFPTLNAAMPLPPAKDPDPSCDKRPLVARLSGATGRSLFVTWVAGECDDRLDVASDAAGDILLAGTSTSLSYPVMDAWQPARGGDPMRRVQDGVVTRLDGMGRFRTSTYVGGPGVDALQSVAIDEGGRVVVAGWGAAGFPQKLDMGIPEPAGDPASTYVAVARFNLSGRATLSTILGGDAARTGPAASRAIDVATDGSDIVVTGLSNTPDFPSSPGSEMLPPPCCDTGADLSSGFVSRIASTVTQLNEPTAADRPLTVHHAGSTQVVLGWDETLGGRPGTDFGLYVGTLWALRGGTYDHQPMAPCAHDLPPATYPMPAEDSYFLLTQLKVADESSYGRDSFGRERPEAEAPCR